MSKFKDNFTALLTEVCTGKTPVAAEQYKSAIKRAFLAFVGQPVVSYTSADATHAWPFGRGASFRAGKLALSIATITTHVLLVGAITVVPSRPALQEALLRDGLLPPVAEWPTILGVQPPSHLLVDIIRGRRMAVSPYHVTATLQHPRGYRGSVSRGETVTRFLETLVDTHLASHLRMHGRGVSDVHSVMAAVPPSALKATLVDALRPYGIDNLSATKKASLAKLVGIIQAHPEAFEFLVDEKPMPPADASSLHYPRQVDPAWPSFASEHWHVASHDNTSTLKCRNGFAARVKLSVCLDYGHGAHVHVFAVQWHGMQSSELPTSVNTFIRGRNTEASEKIARIWIYTQPATFRQSLARADLGSAGDMEYVDAMVHRSYQEGAEKPAQEVIEELQERLKSGVTQTDGKLERMEGGGHLITPTASFSLCRSRRCRRDGKTGSPNT